MGRIPWGMGVRSSVRATRAKLRFMNEIILHHYEGSPYAEKIRLLLGARGLAWRSVIVSSMLPRPELAALAGGY